MDRSINRRKLLQVTALGAVGVSVGTGIDVSAQSEGWQQLSPNGALPPARWDHALFADPSGNRLLLFGGRDGGGAAFADSWVYDIEGNSWSQLEIEGPAARFGTANGEDPARERVYLFGGESDVFYNDVWRFSFPKMNWAQLDDGAATAPSPRYGLGGVMAGADQFLITHGFTFDGRFNDTWSYDVTTKTWTDISPNSDAERPLNRCLHETVWDPERQVMLLYGGCSSGFGPCPQGDLWEFDLEQQIWSDITPSTGPTPRSNPAMVWNPLSSGLLLTGGQTDAGKSGELWEATTGDAIAWTDSTSTAEPPARSSHDAVVVGDSVWLFGGTSDAGVLNDLWRLPLV